MLKYENFKRKRYLHFDKPFNINKVESYVTAPEKVALHSFLPFIHYTIDFERYKKEEEAVNKRPIKEKSRDIMYTGHLDGYIYKYYSMKLNKEYNSWAEDNSIDEVSIAYRDNKLGKSNIDFAAEVINQIVLFESSYILIGDFETFFDTLNHQFLKKRIQDILGKDYLEKDWYNVFRSVTKYGYYEKNDLITKFGNDSLLREKNKNSYFDNMKEFRMFQKTKKAYKNKDEEHNISGIPQGTAISAVLANVYASSFDVEMKDIAEQYEGLYRRYSDDFILILPEKQNSSKLTTDLFEDITKRVLQLISDNHLKINEDKTELYKFTNSKILNLKNDTNSHINYLGFIFDGKEVQLRGKSIYKFYRKAKKLIDKAKSAKERRENAGEIVEKLPYRKKIYSLYTDLGEDYKYGNFISYAKKSQKTFDFKSPHTVNLMMNQLKNRKKIIEKELGYKIHTKI